MLSSARVRHDDCSSLRDNRNDRVGHFFWINGRPEHNLRGRIFVGGGFMSNLEDTGFFSEGLMEQVMFQNL